MRIANCVRRICSLRAATQAEAVGVGEEQSVQQGVDFLKEVLGESLISIVAMDTLCKTMSAIAACSKPIKQ